MNQMELKQRMLMCRNAAETAVTPLCAAHPRVTTMSCHYIRCWWPQVPRASQRGRRLPLVSLPAAVRQHPNRSNRKEKGFISVHVQGYCPPRGGSRGGRSLLRWSHHACDSTSQHAHNQKRGSVRAFLSFYHLFPLSQSGPRPRTCSHPQSRRLVMVCSRMSPTGSGFWTLGP